MSIEEFLVKYPDSKIQTSKYRDIQADRCRKGLKKNWSNPEYVEKRKQYLRDHPNLKPLTEEQRKYQKSQLSNRLVELWKNPDYRSKKSEETKLRHESGELTDAIMTGQGKYRIRYECPDGRVVSLKSTYEVIVADFLKDCNIIYRYEKIFSYYDTEKCKYRKYYADFFLPDYNIVLEVKAHWAIDRQNNIDKMKGVLDSGVRFMFITERELGYLVSKDKFEELIQSNKNV